MTVLQEAVQTLAEAKVDALQAQESLRDATERTDLALSLARDIGARRTSEQLRQVQAQMRSANEQTAAVISGLNRAHVITRSLTGSIWKGPRPCGSEVSDLLSVRSSGADRAHRRRQYGRRVRHRRSSDSSTVRAYRSSLYPALALNTTQIFAASRWAVAGIPELGLWGLWRMMRYREVDDVAARRFPRRHGRNGDAW